MYSIYLALAIGLVTGLGWTLLEFWGGGVMGSMIGIFSTFATFVVIGRRFSPRIQPVIMKAQKQAEGGNVLIALNTVQSLLPFGKWIPMLEGQLYAQLGVLSLGAGKKDQAVEYLEKASARAGEAKLFLACMYFRDGKFDDTKRVLDASQRWNKKHVLFHNAYAYLLMKQGDLEGAILQLNRLITKVPENETTSNNLNRLKNGKKMVMKSFGMEWYALGLEKPPANLGRTQHQPRKGFRQPSKKR